MDRAGHNAQLHGAIVWRNLLLAGMGLSLTGNLLLGLAVLSGRETVVLVPSPAGRVYTAGDSVNAAYLEDMARDVVLTLFNVHAGTTDYVRDAVLKMAHPAFYGQFKLRFDGWMAEVRQRKLATAFYPTTIAADTATLSVRVTGVLRSFIGEAQVDAETVAYRIVFDNAAGRLTLSLIEEETPQ
ncbi:MAG: hypothetical protein GKS00_01790 [Alphaproteobacteria bacterium]|nr:hypothetical protein [Alphaproteobacteria bacterium]